MAEQGTGGRPSAQVKKLQATGATRRWDESQVALKH